MPTSLSASPAPGDYMTRVTFKPATAPWRSRDRASQVAAASLLLAALVLGGAGRGPGDAVVHMVAIFALGLGWHRWAQPRAVTPLQRALLMTLLAAVGVGILQLLPLPAQMFAALPPRAHVLAELQQAGLAPGWMPMTLDVWGTVRAVLALVCFLAMWLLCTTLPLDQRIQLLKLAVSAAVPMAMLGFFQANAKLDTTGGSGLFENRNHFASLMAMLSPAAIVAGWQSHQRRRWALAGCWYAAAVVLLIAAALSYSRAGSLLAGGAAVATVVLLGRARARDWRVWLAGAVGVAMAAGGIGYFAGDRLLARFGSDAFGDLRWQYVENGWKVLLAYFPWGSGLGSFQAVYERFEPIESLGEFTFARHAHNELLQNTIEAGAAGLLLMLLFLAVAAAAMLRPARGRRPAHAWHAASAIACVVPLLHSAVDYPLRTLACSTVLALVLSIVMDAGGEDPTDGLPSDHGRRRDPGLSGQ